MSHCEKVMPGLTDADILAQINAIPSHAVNTDPAWRTAREWAKAWGLERFAGKHKCDRGVAAGLMEMEERYAGEGRYVRKQSHYKFVGKRKK